MKKFTLEFFDKDLEVKLQDKENKDRITLLKLYLWLKFGLSIIEIFSHLIKGDPINNYKQGFVGLGSHILFIFVLNKFSLTVSQMANFVQVLLPIINLLISIYWTQVKPVPIDQLFVHGGFKSINIMTLYFLGTNFKSNSASYLFAAGIFSYMYLPPVFSYNTSNYLVANIWVIGMKYVVDRDRRNQFLLKIKDESWTHIMKDMIDDWVVMVTHNSERDQITARDTNQNFQRSCKIYDDKNFRTFVRSIHVQPINEGKARPNESLDTQIESLKQQLNMEQKSDLDGQINNYPELEIVLRQNLQQKNNLMISQDIKGSITWNQTIDSIKVKKYIGVKFDTVRRIFSFYSVRLIRGSDSEPFILLLIKEINTRNSTKYQNESQLMKSNMIKMSNMCAQYSEITKKLHNQLQLQGNNQSTPNPSTFLESKQLSVINSHYVHQLYLNQMHNIDNIKFENSISLIKIKQIIETLKQLKKNQIKIVLKTNLNDQNFSIKCFRREIIQLFLIIIENTIQHSKMKTPIIKIRINEVSEDILEFQFYDVGQGISDSLLSQLLDSYKINIKREKRDKRLVILNQHEYNVHVKQKLRHGWIVARMILSLLSPKNSFKVVSAPYEGCSISFSLYKDISNVLNVRNLD